MTSRLPRMPAAPWSFSPWMLAALGSDALIALPMSSNMSPSEEPDGVHDEDEAEEEEEEEEDGLEEEEEEEAGVPVLVLSFSLSFLSLDPQTKGRRLLLPCFFRYSSEGGEEGSSLKAQVAVRVC